MDSALVDRRYATTSPNLTQLHLVTIDAQTSTWILINQDFRSLRGLRTSPVAGPIWTSHCRQSQPPDGARDCNCLPSTGNRPPPTAPPEGLPASAEAIRYPRSRCRRTRSTFRRSSLFPAARNRRDSPDTPYLVCPLLLDKTTP